MGSKSPFMVTLNGTSLTKPVMLDPRLLKVQETALLGYIYNVYHISFHKNNYCGIVKTKIFHYFDRSK